MSQTDQPEETSAPSGLSEQAIVEAACRLIADVGVGRLTMRLLSDELGVALGATYHHVPTRDALLVLVIKRLQGDIELTSTDPTNWASTIRALMLDFARVFGTHNGLAEFALSHLEATGPADLRDQVLTLLDDVGFTPESARNLLGALFFYVGGVAIGGLPDEPAYPAAQMTSQFEAGLDLLLMGAEAQLDIDRRSRPIA